MDLNRVPPDHKRNCLTTEPIKYPHGLFTFKHLLHDGDASGRVSLVMAMAVFIVCICELGFCKKEEFLYK